MKVLMVKPTFFEVKYAINPHMQAKDGTLNTIDDEKALEQWLSLVSEFEKIGLDVAIIEGGQHLPDMVFSANHALPFLNKKAVIMGKMAHLNRAAEVPLFRKWYADNGYEIFDLELNEGESFEGMGDAIWANDPQVLFGGYGLRTSESIYHQISEKFGIQTIPLKLISEHFYHLDTCFCVLKKDTVAIVSSAFEENSLKKIHDYFKHVIEIDFHEAMDNFAANSFCPDEKHVILHHGSVKYMAELKKHNLIPIGVDTSEYIKAGGSVFCMKMVVEA